MTNSAFITRFGAFFAGIAILGLALSTGPALSAPLLIIALFVLFFGIFKMVGLLDSRDKKENRSDS